MYPSGSLVCGMDTAAVMVGGKPAQVFRMWIVGPRDTGNKKKLFKMMNSIFFNGFANFKCFFLFLTSFCPNSWHDNCSLVNSTETICFHMPIIYKVDLAAPLNSPKHDSFFQRTTCVVTQIKHGGFLWVFFISVCVKMLRKHPYTYQLYLIYLHFNQMWSERCQKGGK